MKNGEKLRGEEKDWVRGKVKRKRYLKRGVGLEGWMFEFWEIVGR